MAVTPAELVRRYPRLYHMAHAGSWETIQRHGLLSTSALLDLFEVRGVERARIELQHRPESVPLRHPVHGHAVVRDQKPMREAALRSALSDGTKPQEWYALLNERVFFWLTRERLERLCDARAYRDQAHTVLTVDTASLLRVHAERVALSPINSGSTVYAPAPRGRHTFLPLEAYPWKERVRKGRGKDVAVELTVTGGVPEIADHLLQVEEYDGDRPIRVLWPRSDAA